MPQSSEYFITQINVFYLREFNIVFFFFLLILTYFKPMNLSEHNYDCLLKDLNL